MNDRKRWPSKKAAIDFIRAYEKRVDVVVKKNDKTIILEGPKGLSYWAAKDFVSNNGDAQ